MRVKFTGAGQTGRFTFKVGDEADLPDNQADVYIRTGLAVEVRDKKAEVKQNGS